MARTGISYEQVSAAADAIIGEGGNPTIIAVRERIGTGSPNTVHKHLTAWRAARPQATVTAVELPANLVASIASEIERSSAQARSEVETRLVQAQAEAADLAAAADTFEEERDSLAEQVTQLSSDRDRQAATAAERALEVSRLNDELGRERNSAEQARIEVAQVRNKLESNAEKLTEQTALIEQLRAQIDEQTKGRNEAEKNAAVLAAQLEGMTLRATSAESNVSELKAQVRQCQESLGLVNQKVELKDNELAGAVVRVNALQEQVNGLGRDLETAQKAEKIAIQEAAELRGKMSIPQVASVAAVADPVTPATKPKRTRTKTPPVTE